MIQRFPIVLAEVKACDTSENLLNESNKSYILCIEEKKQLKMYTTILWIQ